MAESGFQFGIKISRAYSPRSDFEKISQRLGALILPNDNESTDRFCQSVVSVCPEHYRRRRLRIAAQSGRHRHRQSGIALVLDWSERVEFTADLAGDCRDYRRSGDLALYLEIHPPLDCLPVVASGRRVGADQLLVDSQGSYFSAAMVRNCPGDYRFGYCRQTRRGIGATIMTAMALAAISIWLATF